MARARRGASDGATTPTITTTRTNITIQASRMPRASCGARPGLRAAALREAEAHRRARDEAAEQARDPDAVLGAEQLHQQVAREVQPRDQHHHQPDLVRVHHVEGRRPEVLVRNEGQDDDAHDRELERRLDVRRLDAARELVQPLLQREHAAARHGEAGRERHLAAQAQVAEQEGEQRRDLGGDSEVPPRRADGVGHGHEPGNSHEEREGEPRLLERLLEVGGQGARERDQPEGPHPGEAALLALLALALEAEQHAEPERRGELQRSLKGVCVHRRRTLGRGADRCGAASVDIARPASKTRL